MRRAVRAAAAALAAALAPFAAAADTGAPLAAGDPARGEKAFRKCAACHTAEKGGRHRIGPNLWGVVGAPAAARDGFRYSTAMKGFGETWTPERLDAYLAKPRAVVRGTTMAFPGLRRDRERADVIAFLGRMADAPAGPAPPAAAKAEARAAPEAEDFGVLVAAPGASETFAACAACHSERLVAQQGMTRAQWDELLDWMVEEHEMEPITGGPRATVLDYLARHYGPDRPNFPLR